VVVHGPHRRQKGPAIACSTRLCLSREKRREVEPALASLPEWLVPAFVAITRLGNVAVLFTLFTVDYIPHVASTWVRVVLLAGLLPVLLVAAYFSTRADIARPLAFVLSAFVTASIVAAPRAAKPIE